MHCPQVHCSALTLPSTSQCLLLTWSSLEWLHDVVRKMKSPPIWCLLAISKATNVIELERRCVFKILSRPLYSVSPYSSTSCSPRLNFTESWTWPSNCPISFANSTFFDNTISRSSKHWPALRFTESLAKAKMTEGDMRPSFPNLCFVSQVLQEELLDC
jgi:hypothetical protein